jgi:hypothetical protein
MFWAVHAPEVFVNVVALASVVPQGPPVRISTVGKLKVLLNEYSKSNANPVLGIAKAIEVIYDPNPLKE